MKYCLTFLAIFWLFAACKEDKPLKIAADLYVRYEQDDKKLKAEALFFEVDSLSKGKNLIFQNGVTLNGTKMLTITLPGGLVRYELEQTSGTLAPQYDFQFQDMAGEKHSLSLAVNPFDKIGVTDTTCQNLPCINVSFEGPEIAKDEKLVLMFTDTASTSQSLEIKGPIVKNQIPVSPTQLNRLKPGPATAYLVRSKTISVKEGGVLAKKLVEFYSSSSAVEIKR